MTHRTSISTVKEAQICVRISGFVDEWLSARAREVGSKADVVRGLIEQEMAREEEASLRTMFDTAAREMDEEEREDLERLLGAFEPKEIDGRAGCPTMP